MPRNHQSKKPSRVPAKVDKSDKPEKPDRNDRNDRADRSDRLDRSDDGTRWRGEATNYKGLPSTASDGKKHRAPQQQNPAENGSHHHHHSFESGCRDFETYLCFEQELVSVPIPTDSVPKDAPNVSVPKDAPQAKYVARPREEAPTPRIVGKAQFHFARDLSRMYYRIYVFCQAPEGSANANTSITFAHLCAGCSSENGPLVAILAKIDTAPQPVGKNGQGVQTKGEMSNSDIQNVTSSSGYTYNSVASVYDGILRGDIYLNILGNKNTAGQVTYDQGLIRGQIYHP